MSIFIAMPTMHDTEFEATILDAFSKANKPEDIYFGIRSMSSSDKEKEKLDKVKNQFGKRIRGYVDTISEHNRLQKLGTGIARKAVAELYDGEDYILSIDSHTLFIDGWDSLLIKLYKEAVVETGNLKSILTAYPSKYKYINGERKFLDSNMLYPYIGWEQNWTLDEFPFLSRPLWEGCLPWMVKPLQHSVKKFLPTGKFSYNFSFSGQMFLYDEDTEIVIMEEDMIKTFKLLHDGWELVHHNIGEPIIGHMYLTEIDINGGSRAYWHMFCSEEEKQMLEKKELENFYRYYNDPKYSDTINKYEDWMKASFKEQSQHNYHIPKDWFHNV